MKKQWQCIITLPEKEKQEMFLPEEITMKSKEKTSVSGSAISVTPPAHGCLVFRVEN